MVEVIRVLLVKFIHLIHVDGAGVQVDQVYGDPVRAEAGEAFLHVGHLTVDDADQYDDCRHADDDAEHGQERAHLVAQDALQGKEK